MKRKDSCAPLYSNLLFFGLIIFFCLAEKSVFSQNTIQENSIKNVNFLSGSDFFGEIPAIEAPQDDSNNIESPDSILNNIPEYQTYSTNSNEILSPKIPISSESISISAQFGWQGESTEDGQVYVLSGECQLSQGVDVVSGPKAVVWIQNADENGVSLESQVIIYLEKENQWTPLKIDLNSPFVEARATDNAWLGTFRTSDKIGLHIAEPGSDQLKPDEIYYRAAQTREKKIESSEISQNIPLTSELSQGLAEAEKLSTGNLGLRRLRIMSRYDRPDTITVEPDPNDQTKSRWIINSGITIILEGISSEGKTVSDIVDLSADRAVVWTTGIDQFQAQIDKIQPENFDLEIFLEGNIVFREGDRVFYAQKMYYDAKNKVGVIMDAEMISPIPSNPAGILRMKADKIMQTSPDSLKAENAWVSTSMMGYPTYRLQSNTLTAESQKTPLYNSATLQPLIDPETGKPLVQNNQYLIAENNFVALQSIPVFYWPWMAMNTKDQTLYIRNIKLGNDSIFGTQVRTCWNPYQLFGIKNRPEGTDWDINLDYLSKRGLGHGTSFIYNREMSTSWLDSQVIGAASFYGISDKGTDNLGLGRRNVPFKHSYRYRGLWKHRHIINNLGCLGDDWLLTAQLGTSSDRNFIPQYFEEEWFTSPNPETSLELKKTINNQSIALLGSFRLDDFYTQTNWLPRLDHYWLGQPLFTNKLIWYEHTKIGYAQFRTTAAPYALEDEKLFRYLNWELNPNSTSNSPFNAGTETLSRDSLNFSTRHELDVPLEAGPFKITPYGLGEYAFWSAGTNDKSVQRLYGRGGIRANLPIWKVDSEVSSKIWYLNGLAHKMDFAVDASYSAVDTPFSDLVLYEQLDDWQIEDFRRRYSVTTFENAGVGGFLDDIPVRFDERYYAIRHGQLAGSVTSPSTEIANDLKLVRLEWQNRWQTKRGSIAKRHTIDWITFNTGLNIYPDADENYGKNVGLIDYDFRWHIGDRVSLLSSGIYDVFNSGQKISRIGLMSKRPGLSSFFVGLDRLNGPIDSTYLNIDLKYRMSEKWATGISNSYDLSEGTNVGQKIAISRIGESFIFTLSGTINQSKDNWGINLSVEPVFIYNWTKKGEGILELGSM
ncbi:MAG: hypothetical protein Q4C95_06220 [Planctomycetia bacterium]|nr:hypothetical protein [Planctomycetia bacterium]